MNPIGLDSADPFRKTVSGLTGVLPGLPVELRARWDRFTSLGAGTAEFILIRPRDVEELSGAVRYFLKAGIRMYPLGAGTNLAGSDSPLECIFISTAALTDFRPEGKGLFYAGSGLRFTELIRRTAGLGFGGIAALAGIPGSFGGAIVMNAGANGMETGPFIRRIEGIALSTGETKVLIPGRTDWGYRRSPVPRDFLVTGAVLENFPCDPETEVLKIREELQRRIRVTPPGRSAGSVFRNPDGNPAGKLLEQAGCKGKRCGAFMAAPEHANWIVSRTEETPRSEKDLIELAETMRSAVYSQSGITLKRELRFVKMETSKLKIVVLKGGTSSEREVSLISGKAVADALRSKGHDVEEYDITELKITDAMRKADVVYPVLHGGFGEDGRVQKMMEDAGIKFVGCGSKACADLMDKVISKQIMDAAGIRNAAYAVVSEPDAPVISKFGFPVIVKPPCEGSTFGLSLVETPDQWSDALKLAFKHDKVALVEQYVKGVEATVGILDGKTLPLIEIRYPGKLYDYDAKYTHALGETQYICPPTGISGKACRDAADQALRFYKAANARDMLRVDVIIDDKDQAWVLEGNTLPGCTPSSLLPKAAATAGIPFADMCDHLARTAAGR